MTARSDLHVVVVGAGFGGLAAAAHLARAGVQVTIIEKAHGVGGKAACLQKSGFTFDAGPTLLTMPDIVAETFAAAGVDIADVAPLERVEPACRYVFADGADLSLSADPDGARSAVARICRQDAARWEGFYRESRGLWEGLGEPYLEAPFTGFAGYLRRILRGGAKALQLAAARGTLDAFARRHFRSPAMRQFVGHFATYAGASPLQASAALAMIPYVEIGIGAFYPRGGISRLATELGRALEARGVTIVTNTEVTAIDVDARGRATGVTLDRGGAGRASVHLRADAVVANVDPRVVISRLLPPARRRRAGELGLTRREPSLSGFAWAFGLEGPAPTSTLHTLFVAPDPDEEMRAVFDRQVFAREPTILVSVPSLLDASRAPRGHHSVFTLLYAPAMATTTDWQRETPRLREIIRARLARAWGVGFADAIRAEVFVTPRDIATTGSADGAIYGAAPHGALATFTRPLNRARGVRGLYFAGGVTHPGGGVTLVMRGGRFAAELLLDDARRNLLTRPEGRRSSHVFLVR